MKSLFLVASSLILCLSGISAIEDKKTIRIPIKRANTPVTQNKYNKRATTEPLINAGGLEYLIEVGVGSPPQIFNLTMDTGR